MAIKATKSKKSANTKSTQQSYVPTPWLRLKEMWEAGVSYEAMAKATDAHFDPKKPDPTKATRAKIWKARNVGVTIDGKLVKFAARGKVKEQAGKGKGSKEKKRVTRKGKATEAVTKPEASAETKSEQSKVEPSNRAEQSTKKMSA